MTAMWLKDHSLNTDLIMFELNVSYWKRETWKDATLKKTGVIENINAFRWMNVRLEMWRTTTLGKAGFSGNLSTSAFY